MEARQPDEATSNSESPPKGTQAHKEAKAEPSDDAKSDPALARPRKLLPKTMDATEPADAKDLKDAHRRPGYQGWLTSPRETLEEDAKRKVRTTTAVFIACIVATAVIVGILMLIR